MKTLEISTTESKQVIDITSDIDRILGKQSRKDGLCHLFITHTTASLATADLDPGTDLDFLDAVDAILPKIKYRHPHNPSHVVDHIASTMIGTDLTLPFEKKKLILGTWQRVVLVEFDGPRKRQVLVNVLSAS